MVVTGKLKGVPYSVSANGNGRECTWEEYKALTDSQKQEVSNIYGYGHDKDYQYQYWRISAKYGMSCATFVWSCVSQALPVQRTAGAPNIPNLWGEYLTKTSYSALEKGDILQKSDHVMLVVSNNKSNKMLTVIEQASPDFGTITNLGTIYIPPHGYFDAGLCDTSTIGTCENTYYYSSLSSYTAYHVNYWDDPEKQDLPWNGSDWLTNVNNLGYQPRIYTRENKEYAVYSDPYLEHNLTYPNRINWTDGSEEAILVKIGRNYKDIWYAYVELPTSHGPDYFYVNLFDTYITGNLSEFATTYYDTHSYYRRRGSDSDSRYYTKAGDAIFRLTEDNGWSQIAF